MQTVESIDALIQRIRIMQAEQSPGQRLLVAIAGAPGAGKSTLAVDVCQRFNATAERSAPPSGRVDNAVRAQAGRLEEASVQMSAGQAVVVPMDGFHLDDVLLSERGLLPVKGSPQTFDVHGFVNLVQRLVASAEEPVYIPVFDRQLELSRNAAQVVDNRHAVVIIEGNYLLLDRPGWSSLAPLFHVSIMLDVPLETLEERLVQRWLDHGHDPEQARTRALSNDIPNAKVVLQESSRADLLYRSVRQ